MKNYLVAYDTGSSVIRTVTVETEDGYIPSSDNCLELKKLVCGKDRPRTTRVFSAPESCGGYRQVVDGKEINPEELHVIAVSNLDV